MWREICLTNTPLPHIAGTCAANQRAPTLGCKPVIGWLRQPVMCKTGAPCHVHKATNPPLPHATSDGATASS